MMVLDRINHCPLRTLVLAREAGSLAVIRLEMLLEAEPASQQAPGSEWAARRQAVQTEISMESA